MTHDACVCPICDASRGEVVLQWQDFSITQCAECGFRHVDTRTPEYPANAQYTFDQPGQLPPSNPELPHIRRRVRDVLDFKQAPGRALDVGCGKGEVSLALHASGFECTAVDMKPELINQLAQRYPAVSWSTASFDDLRAAGESFDLITLYHVLEHIPKPAKVLLDLRRLARPGAVFAVEVPNVGGLEALLRGRDWHYYKVDHVNYFRRNDLTRLAAKVGLKVLDIRGYQHFSYPQDVLWKDLVKGGAAKLGFQDVISIFLTAA
jgi:2-polyprenyl-3-methyl-5-hydroxy-6-metoxy-1,4-benzoquinol methylase